MWRRNRDQVVGGHPLLQNTYPTDRDSSHPYTPKSGNKSSCQSVSRCYYYHAWMCMQGDQVVKTLVPPTQALHICRQATQIAEIDLRIIISSLYPCVSSNHTLAIHRLISCIVVHLTTSKLVMMVVLHPSSVLHELFALSYHHRYHELTVNVFMR